MIKGVLAASVTMLWSVGDAAACAIQVTRPVQVMAREATAIVEATALDTIRTFDVVRTFRGAPPSPIALGPGSSCDDPTVRGARYLLFVHRDHTYVVPATEDALRYLTSPRRVTRRELTRMLEKWSARRITDQELVAWVDDVRQAGEVDDWTVIDGSTVSPTLSTLRLLDGYFERLPCSIEQLRTRIAPRVLRLLRKRVITARDAELLERDPCLS